LLRTRLSITMAPHMSDIQKMRKLGGDKIGLLGLFALALLAARLTVAWKSAISFSEPIPLPHTGLSVSMPMGKGWHSEGRWEYTDNTFIVRSVFAPRSGKPTAWAHCQYRLGADTAAPDVQLERKASEVDGEIVKTGQVQAADLTVHWARVERPEILLTTFSGTARLPNERQLDIEVHQIMSDPELSERVFKRILEGLSFKDDGLLEGGAEVTATIKGKGINNYLDNHNQQAAFLIKGSAGQLLGFTMDVLVDSGKDVRLNVRAAGLLYIGGRNAVEQETSFQSSNNLDEFTYRSEVYSGEGRSGSEVVQDAPGTVTVRTSGPRTDAKAYRLGPAALPDVFFDQVFRQMLDSDKQEIIVDAIDATGKITPTFVSRIEAMNDIVAGSDAAYVFNLAYLDGRGFSQQVYLDAQGKIYRSLIQQENTYVLDRTSIEDIVKEFPEHAERILRNSQMLK